MKKPTITTIVTITLLAILSGILNGCSKDEPNNNNQTNNPTPENNVINKTVSTNRLKGLWIKEDGENPEWQIEKGQKDIVIYPDDNKCFVIAAKAGNYKLRFISSNSEKDILYKIEVKESKCTDEVSEVLDFHPAPGQFVNDLPKWENGTTQEEMNERCLKILQEKGLISLGAYGGSITFRFDHSIINREGFDFAIFGNAFEGSSEPGIVMVAWDKNDNGKPDEDEWYELAGSMHNDPETIHNYQITYTRPREGKREYPEPQNGYSDRRYIKWEDNIDEKGYLPKLTAHNQDYWPGWYEGTEAKTLVFTGTKLPQNANNIDGIWKLKAFEWGYVDNKPNNDEAANSFDIDWAVDKNGNKVKLPAVDFIKVYNGMNQVCGPIGETSTEITYAKDLAL